MATQRGLAGSSAIMFSGTLVSRILGLVRNALLVAAIGASAGQADPFAVANTLPNIIYNLLAGGVLNAILVPQVVRALRRRDGDEYVNRLLTMAGLILFAITVIATASSSLIVALYASQMDPRWYSLAIAFALWCIPQVFFYGVYTLLGQVLNAKGSFGPYMWAPVANNVVAIIGLIIYLAVFGFARDGSGTDPAEWTGVRIALLAGVATLGVAVQAGVLVVALRRTGFRYRWRTGVHGLGGASRMAMWSFAGLAVGQIGFLAVTNVAAAANGAAALTDASLPANQTYNNAFLIYMLPQSLFTTSLITALFPRMSAKAAAGDRRGVRTDFSLGVRVITSFTVFAALALTVFAIPVAHVVLPSATPEEARNVAAVLVPLALGIPFQGIWSLIQRAFFSFEDARTLFFINIPMAAVQVVVSLFAWRTLAPQWWVPVAAGSTALSMLIGASVGARLLTRHLPASEVRSTSVFARLILAGALAAFAGWGVVRILGLPVAGAARETFMHSVLLTVLGGLVMAFVYWLAARLLGVRDLDYIISRGLRLVTSLGARVPGLNRLPGLSRPSAGAHSGSEARDNSPSASAADVGRVATIVENRGENPTRTNEDEPAVNENPLVGGRYQVTEPLDIPPVDGGRWYRGTDTVLDAPVAIFRGPDGDDGQLVIDFARRALLVEDERLIPILDIDIDEDGRTFVVVEAPSEHSLAGARGQLTPVQAGAIVGEVAQALESARLGGVHHLALDPSHVRLHPDGSVRVLGLGTDGALAEFADDGDAVERSLQASERDASLLQALWTFLTGDPGTQALVEARNAGDVALALQPWDQRALDSALVTLDVGTGVGQPRWEPVRARGADAAPRREHTADRDARGEVSRQDGTPAPGRLTAANDTPPPPAASAPDAGVELPPPPSERPGAGHAEDGPETEPTPPNDGASDPASQGVPDGDPCAAESADAAEDEAPEDAAPLEEEGPRVDPQRLAAWRPRLGASMTDLPDFEGILEQDPDQDLNSRPVATHAASGAPAAAVPVTDTSEGRSQEDAESMDSATPEYTTPLDEEPSSETDEDHPPAPEGPATQAPTGEAGADVAAQDPPAPMPVPPPITRAQGRERTRMKSARWAEATADTATARAVEAAERARAAADRARAASRRQAGVTTERIEGLVTRLDGFAAKHDFNLPGEVEEYDRSTPLSRRRIDPSPLILAFFAGLLVLFLILAMMNLRSPGRPAPAAPSETASPSPTAVETEEPEENEAPAEPTQEPAVAPQLASIDILDPQGDGAENPDLTDRAMDGDPESYWRSRSYVNPQYGMKTGIGLRLNLVENAEVSAVTLTLHGSGGHVQVRQSADNPEDGQILAEGDMGQSTELTFDPVEVDSLVLWFTSLPQAASDGKNRIELTSVSIE
ncbi:MAG: lipid II flippase MurJ [Bowdeniella nasicola]|nr:lipid II flippase MurJ [Bowdeniella nasicola]